jgi:NAD(P)-dependent dehydrogenase (short-subunit alcohol dehydrogenase family)
VFSQPEQESSDDAREAMTERDEGKGRVALITGGASGIGLASATMLASRGWRVVIGDLNVEQCRAAAQPIGAEFSVFDVADEKATEHAIAEIEARVGPVDALMANAGVMQRATPPEDFQLADFDRIVAVNLRGVYLSCVAAGRRMAVRGRGGIVITGSIAGLRALPLHAYAPTKAAVVHLATCLATEWGRSGVRVNAVSPGYVTTPPLMAAIERGQRDPDQLSETSALGRMVEPVEVARAVAFLLSDDAGAITGVNLPVDAGWLAACHMATYGGVQAAR